jgi:hypothetical protein
VQGEDDGFIRAHQIEQLQTPPGRNTSLTHRGRTGRLTTEGGTKLVVKGVITHGTVHRGIYNCHRLGTLRP